MLIADNRAYDYSRKEQFQEETIQKQPNRKTVNKPKRAARPKLHLISIMFLFSLGIFIISRYAYIAEINFNINSLNKDYKNIQKENSDLNVELMKTVNLETLEQTAVEKLHMQYPDTNSQIIYVEVPNPENLKKNSFYGEYSNLEDIRQNKYISYAKSLMNSIIKVLD